MIEKFNGIFYLIVFIVHFLGYAVYAYRCVFGTKSGVVGVVEPHGDDLRGLNRNERPKPFFWNRRLLEGWCPKNIALELVQVSIDDLGVKDIIPLLK